MFGSEKPGAGKLTSIELFDSEQPGEGKLTAIELFDSEQAGAGKLNFEKTLVDSYERFCRFLSERSGISLSREKQYLIESRLKNILLDEGLPSLEGLLDFIEKNQNAALADRVVDAMTTNETFWFRDHGLFSYLHKTLIPQLIERNTGGKRVDIWSAASSSGQEAYSVSILIEECLRPFHARKPSVADPFFRIVGTDICSTMIAHARNATYSNLELSRGLPEAYLNRYFQSLGDRAHLKEEVSKHTRFVRHNLRESFDALGKFDVIFCRNVLIYFDDAMVEDILRRFHQSLKPGGVLFLSASETVKGLRDLYQLESIPGGFVYRAIH